MQLSVYRPVLALPEARAALLLGFFIRVPLFAGGVILTLHVVSALHRSYGEAGLLTTAATIALAISSPWRGRMLDKRGLRRVVIPSLVVQAVCWSIAPWVDYWWLMGLAALGGLLAVPTFSILRQVLLAVVPEDQRRTGLSLDSIATEFSFMAGPALGVWAATMWHTGWAIFVFEWLSIMAGIVLAVVNPALRPVGPPPARAAEEDPATPATADQTAVAAHPVPAEPPASAADRDAARAAESINPPGVRSWFGLEVLAVLTASAAATVVLAGTDVSIVATLRDMGAQQHIGWVLALWGAGSIVGGVVYGAWHRSIEAFWLLAGLALATAPIALAANLPVAAVLILLSGLFCAPTLTATVDTLTRLVPERSRGEAIGWHGSSMTTGMALGAPLAGFAIDSGGWRWGYVVVSVLGLAVAAAGGAVMTRRSRRPRRPRQALVDSSLAGAR
jgi:MFS family permease